MSELEKRMSMYRALTISERLLFDYASAYGAACAVSVNRTPDGACSVILTMGGAEVVRFPASEQGLSDSERWIREQVG